MDQVEQLSEAQRTQAQEQLLQEIQEAQAAQVLLSNPALDKYFNEIEQRCFNKADELLLSDTVGRDRAYFIIHLSRKFKKALTQYVESGGLAEAQLNELLEDTKKKKSFLGGLLGD